MVLIHICSGTVLAAETSSTDITVDYTIGETVLQLDISDIPVVNARQMLSILLVHKDADANNMSTSEVVYSNTIYLNGQDKVAFDIDIDGIDIEDCRLVIRDSHDSVNYSCLFEIESGGDGTDGAESGGSGAGETKPSDSATEGTKGNASEKDTNKSSTGDDSRAAFLFGMVLISGMVVVAFYNRRHEQGVSKNEN